MSNELSCLECGSTDIGQSVVDNEHRYECQNCYRTWSPEDTVQQNGSKYPEIEVQLVGKDGNAYFILGTVSRALRKADLSEGEIKEFNDEATSGDYDNLLQTCMKWVTVS